MVGDNTQTTYVICKIAHGFRYGHATASIVEELQQHGVTLQTVETMARSMQPFLAPRSGRDSLDFISDSEAKTKVRGAMIVGLWSEQWGKSFKHEAAAALARCIATEPDRVRIAYLYALGQLGVAVPGLSDQLLAISAGTGLLAVCAREAYDLIGYVKDERGAPMQWDLWSTIKNSDEASIRNALRRAKGSRLRDDLARGICELAFTRPGMAHDCFSALRSCKLDVGKVASWVIDGVEHLDNRVDEGARRLLTHWLQQSYASIQAAEAIYEGLLSSPEKTSALLRLTRRTPVREQLLHRVRTEAKPEIVATVVYFLRTAYEDGEEQALEDQLIEMLSYKSAEVRHTALQACEEITPSWKMLGKIRQLSTQTAFALMLDDVLRAGERMEERLVGATWREARSFGADQQPPIDPVLYDTFIDRVTAMIRSNQRYGLPEYRWWFEVSNDYGYLISCGVEKIRFTPLSGSVLVTTAPKHLEFRLEKALASLSPGFGFLLVYCFAAYEAMVTAKPRLVEVPSASPENHYRLDSGKTKSRQRSPLMSPLRVPRMGSSAGSREPGEHAAKGDVTPTYVTCHLRRLQRGHASPEAHKAAAKWAMGVPLGYTFVDGYWKPRGYVPDANDQTERMVTSLDILNETIRKYLRGGGV